MINLLKLFLSKQPKHSQLARTHSGFTLIELLVAIVISSIILGTLLTFMNNILTSERQEQAKATTEQEVQGALDYIANDLQEAVYIYDANGITAIKNQLPNPTDTNRVPVLVFWKRSFFPQTRDIVSASGTSTRVGCLVKIPGNSSGTQKCDNRDYFVYSLVIYYLIKDSDNNWSSAARIGRFEIQDGIKDPYNSNNNLVNTDSGFQLFDLTLSGTLKDKMNAWTKATSNYDLTKNQTRVLVDYIDQSNGSGTPALQNCATVSSNAQQVPANGTTANPLGIYSFYTCVDSSKTLARIYLRGNAQARMNKDATYTSSQSSYFPSASVQVKGRGLIAGE